MINYYQYLCIAWHIIKKNATTIRSLNIEFCVQISISNERRTGMTYYCKSSRDCLEGQQNHGKNALRVFLAEQDIIIIIPDASGSEGIL